MPHVQQGQHFSPFSDSLPQEDQDTTALLTSCHTEEHSHSFAHHRPETHNSWNLYPIEVALNFRNSWSSCYRLQKRNTGVVLHQFHSWPPVSYQKAQQGIKTPCSATSISTVKLAWGLGAESASGNKETSYPGPEQRETVYGATVDLSLTWIRTRRLARKTKVRLNPSSSSKDKARQPFSVHSSTAARMVKENNNISPANTQSFGTVWGSHWYQEPSLHFLIQPGQVTQHIRKPGFLFRAQD